MNSHGPPALPAPGEETDLLLIPTVFPGAEHERPAAFPSLVETLQALAVDAQVKAPGLASPIRRLLVVVAMATAAPAVAVPVRHGRARGDPHLEPPQPPAARAHVNKSERRRSTVLLDHSRHVVRGGTFSLPRQPSRCFCRRTAR